MIKFGLFVSIYIYIYSKYQNMAKQNLIYMIYQKSCV